MLNYNTTEFDDLLEELAQQVKKLQSGMDIHALGHEGRADMYVRLSSTLMDLTDLVDTANRARGL